MCNLKLQNPARSWVGITFSFFKIQVHTCGILFRMRAIEPNKQIHFIKNASLEWKSVLKISRVSQQSILFIDSKVPHDFFFQKKINEEETNKRICQIYLYPLWWNAPNCKFALPVSTQIYILHIH